MNRLLLRITLILTGSVVAVLGANVGFGGIATLGLQGGGEFFHVADPTVFTIQDNHMRFIGGVLIGAGAALIFAGIRLSQAPVLVTAVAVAFVIGGLARFSALDPATLFSAAIMPSLIAELIGFPLLAYWVHRATREGTTA